MSSYDKVIPVLNSTLNPDSLINEYLEICAKQFGIGFKLYESFLDVKEGIVFLNLGTQSKKYPILSKNSNKKILYVYLVGNEDIAIKNMVGCEVHLSDYKPKNFRLFPNFLQAVDVLKTSDKMSESITAYEIVSGEVLPNSDEHDLGSLHINRKFNVLLDFTNIADDAPPAPNHEDFGNRCSLYGSDSDREEVDEF